MKKQKFLLILFTIVVALSGCVEKEREFKEITFSESRSQDYVEEFRIDLPKEGNYTDIYCISETGELKKKIEKGSIGFLSTSGENIWFTKSFYTEKQQREHFGCLIYLMHK